MFELSFLTRLLIFIVGMGLGFAFLLKSLFIVQTVGKSVWAEQHMLGGTYGAVKLFGIGMMIVSVMLLFGG